MDVGVRVTGLRELSTALKRVDSDIPKHLRLEFKQVAEHVVGIAAGKVPRKSGKAAGSIKPRASQKGAGIAFSDSSGSVPYFPWLNFGGRVGRNRSIERAKVTPDRYIYASIAEAKEEITEAADQAIKRAAEAAQFETKGDL